MSQRRRKSSGTSEMIGAKVGSKWKRQSNILEVESWKLDGELT